MPAEQQVAERPRLFTGGGGGNGGMEHANSVDQQISSEESQLHSDSALLEATPAGVVPTPPNATMQKSNSKNNLVGGGGNSRKPPKQPAERSPPLGPQQQQLSSTGSAQPPTSGGSFHLGAASHTRHPHSTSPLATSLPAQAPPFSGETLHAQYRELLRGYDLNNLRDVRNSSDKTGHAVAVALCELVERFIAIDRESGGHSMTSFPDIPHGLAHALQGGNRSRTGLPTIASMDLLGDYDHISASVAHSRAPSPTQHHHSMGGFPTMSHHAHQHGGSGHHHPHHTQQHLSAQHLGAKKVSSTTVTPERSPIDQSLEIPPPEKSIDSHHHPANGPGTTYYRTLSMNSAASVLTYHPGQYTKVEDTSTLTKIKDQMTGTKTINEYVIVGNLGKGAYGKVKLAQTIDGEYRAIKVINRSMMLKKGSKAYEKIQSEIAVMKKVQHKNLARLYEVINDEQSEKIYLVMQYFAKGKIVILSPEFTCEPLPINQVKIYFKQLVEGLRVLHKNGVFHRDIKPDNILLDDNDNCCLADFGVSAICSDENGVHGVEGTPFFMAPEVTRGDSRVNGELVDIWALGVTLYLLLYGHLPFQGDSIMSTLHKVRTAEPVFPEGSPEDFNDIIRKLLAKDPEERMKLRTLRRSRFLRSVVLPGANVEGAEDCVLSEQTSPQASPLSSNQETAATTTTAAVESRSRGNSQKRRSVSRDGIDNNEETPSTPERNVKELFGVSKLDENNLGNSPGLASVDGDDEGMMSMGQNDDCLVKLTKDDINDAIGLQTAGEYLFSPQSRRVGDIRKIATASQLYSNASQNNYSTEFGSATGLNYVAEQSGSNTSVGHAGSITARYTCGQFSSTGHSGGMPTLSGGGDNTILSTLVGDMPPGATVPKFIGGGGPGFPGYSASGSGGIPMRGGGGGVSSFSIPKSLSASGPVPPARSGNWTGPMTGAPQPQPPTEPQLVPVPDTPGNPRQSQITFEANVDKVPTGKAKRRSLTRSEPEITPTPASGEVHHSSSVSPVRDQSGSSVADSIVTPMRSTSNLSHTVRPESDEVSDHAPTPNAPTPSLDNQPRQHGVLMASTGSTNSNNNGTNEPLHVLATKMGTGRRVSEAPTVPEDLVPTFPALDVTSATPSDASSPHIDSISPKPGDLSTNIINT